MTKTIKFTCIIILFLIAKNTIAQNSKLNFEAEFTPKICFRMEYDDNDVWGFNRYKEFRKPIALFDAGFNIKYILNEKHRIGSGVFYSVIGNILKYDIADNYDYTVIHHFSADFTYSYIEMPVFYEYYFKRGIYLKTGLIYRRAVSGKIIHENLPDSLFGYSRNVFIEIFDKTYTSSDLKEQNLNMNNIGLLIGTGKNFNISEKMYLELGLQFKTNLFPAFRKGNRIDFYYYSTGINLKIGLKWKS